MNTIRKILVPVDFSECSLNALSYALNLAVNIQAEVNILNTFEFENMYIETKANNTALLEQKKECKALLKKEVSKFTGTYKGAPVVRTYCKMGSLVKVINNFVRNKRADLIIMGTYSKNPLKRFLLGSSAISVMEKVNSPVLLVPPSCHYTGIKNIAFSTNYHSGGIYTLRQLIEMFGSLNPHLCILHFNTANKTAHKKKDFSLAVKEEVKYNDIQFMEMPAQNLQSGSAEYIRKNKTDLLAMSNKRRSGLASFFNTPAEEAAIYTKIPLLVMPRERLTLNISLKAEEIL